MIRFDKILKYLTAIFAISLLSACVSESVEVPTGESDENWITLQFILPDGKAATRSETQSGEEGKGREKGIGEENILHDLNLFLFANNGTSFLNAAGTTPLIHIYFNLDDTDDTENSISFELEGPEDSASPYDKVYTIKFLLPSDKNCLIDEGRVCFITVANLNKKMEKPVDSDFTLSYLRNYDNITATWTGSVQSVEDYSNFVMTTAYDDLTDSYVDFNVKNGTDKYPFWGQTTLQRMCARIDVMYMSENEVSELLTEEQPTGLIKYTVDVKGCNNLVYVSHILPVNIMSKPSYLFKKVTSDIIWDNKNDFKWGGKEKTNVSDGKPANFVLEPTTHLKKGSSDKRSEWYGATRPSKLINEGGENSIKSGKGSVAGYYASDIASYDNNGYDKVRIITYANENTQNLLSVSPDYLTGLAIRAIYRPDHVYSDADLTAPAEGEKPTGIWRYSPSSKALDASADEINDTDESRSLYFTNDKAAEDYKNSHPTENGIITHFPEVVIFGGASTGHFGFYSYYNLWIRHNDAAPAEDYPMKYAIVRNNIYRVSLSFSGPGDPTPTMREPDTMKSRIFVRKWNTRLENNPLEF